MNKKQLTFNTPGAPFGGRVHSLIDYLPPAFNKQYEKIYNYKFKNYMFIRKGGYLGRTVIDTFIIVRTSRRCYRVNYCNVNHLYFCTFSVKTPKELAERMYSIFKVFERVDNENN